MDSLISVIVPVYNSQQYLEQCVQSILHQTYTNLEIILVDDGSTDNCPAICDSLAKTDRRIKIIHKENGGASDARNTGVRAAKGKYVTFVDCDDWLHSEMLSVLSNALASNEADLAMCGYQVIRHAKEVKEKMVGGFSWKVYTGKQTLERLLYQKLSGSAWAILLLRELAREIVFPKDYVYGEDLTTVYRYCRKIQNAVYVPSKLYFYRDNPRGLMRRPFDEKIFDLVNITDDIVGFAEKNMPELLAAANARRFSAYAQVLRKMPPEPEEAGLISREKKLWIFLKEYRWKMMFDHKARIKNRIGAFCTLLGERVFKRLMQKNC